MSKAQHLTAPVSAKKARNECTLTLAHIIAVACLAVLYLLHQTMPRANILSTSPSSGNSFRWSAITPSTELDYQDCYDGLQCARLEVPLDYGKPDDFPKVTLAVIRRPAKVSITSPHYGGAVITNPGGPGGSGVQQQLMMGEYMQDLFDAQRTPPEASSQDRYFDIISFDPRGINHTTPTVACFPDNASRERWNLQWEAEGILGSSNTSLRMNWRRATALAGGCSKMLSTEETHSLAEHMNTTPIAADVMTIVEAHGRWREKQGNKVARRDRSVLARLAYREGEERLLYHGYSWGSLLGSTIAAMYPERIERMVLDGIVETDDYYGGKWVQNLRDTDKILEQFMQQCAQAGPDKCAFWRRGGSRAIDAAYEKLLLDIQGDSLAVPGSEYRGPEVITWTDVKLLVKDAMYQPLRGFPTMAEMLQDITDGNGSRFADYKNLHRKSLCQTSSPCEVPFSHECILPGWSPFDVLPAILCTDAEDAGAFTENDFRLYWHGLRNQSRAMGDYWASTRLTCAGWNAKAKWRFGGPFSANTSHPLLYIGNTFDTVTPFRNAEKMSTKFPGSGLLQQDTVGHCSFTSPSLCTAKVVNRYFQQGTLPDHGTICGTDSSPFDDRSVLPLPASNSDRALLQTIQKISRRYRAPTMSWL